MMSSVWSLSAATEVDDDDASTILLRERCLAVALQDPDWVQTYVVDILGPDAVGGDVVAALQQQAREEYSSSESSAQPTTLLRVEQPPDGMGGDDSDDEVLVDLDGASSMKVLVVQVQTPAEATQDQGDDDKVAYDGTTTASLQFLPTEGAETLHMDPSIVDIVAVNPDNRSDDSIFTNATWTATPEGVLPGDGRMEVDPTGTGERDERDPAVQEERSVPTAANAEPVSRASAVVNSSSDTTSGKETRDTPTPIPDWKTPATEKSLTATAASPVTDRRQVLYRDGMRNSWLQVPLDKLLQLGYDENEIITLQPDALGLIAQDGIARPSTGVPSRWKINVTERNRPAVRILEPHELDTFWQQQQQQGQRTRLSDPTSKRSATPPSASPQEKSRQTRQSSDVARTKDPVESVPELRRPRPTRERLENGRSRPIYTGRPTIAALEDPPPSSSGIWPDMDSFRNMLRNEASLRLRILGDDWSEVVKEESDWRLDLYKKWLWTLHNGVGDPIVESRSDRMRRLSRKPNDTSGRNRKTPVGTREARDRKRPKSDEGR